MSQSNNNKQTPLFHTTRNVQFKLVYKITTKVGFTFLISFSVQFKLILKLVPNNVELCT